MCLYRPGAKGPIAARWIRHFEGPLGDCVKILGRSRGEDQGKVSHGARRLRSLEHL